MRIRLADAGWPESRAQGELARKPQAIGIDESWSCKHEQGGASPRLDTLFVSPSGEKLVAVELQLGVVDADHITRLLEYTERERSGCSDVRAVLVAEDCTGKHGRLANCLARAGLIEIYLMHVERHSAFEELVIEPHDPGAVLPAAGEKDLEKEWRAKPAFYLVAGLLKRIVEADTIWLPTYHTHIGGKRIEPRFNCVAFHGGSNGIYTVEVKLPRTNDNDQAVQTISNSWSYEHQGRQKREHYRLKIDESWDDDRLRRLGDLLVQANARWQSERIAH